MSCVAEYTTTKTLNDLATQISEWISQNGVENFHLSKLLPLLAKYEGSDWSMCQSTHLKDYCRHRKELAQIEHYGVVYEILILTWNPESGTPVHNHPNTGCIYKILSGELMEDIYDSEQKQSTRLKSSWLKKGDCGYIDDTIGFHRIWNPTKTPSVSVHIYEANYKPECFDGFEIPDCVNGNC